MTINLTENEFVYGYYQKVIGYSTSDSGEEYHFIVNENDEADYIDPNTIGQYTGLKDKNGNKIFEGDLIQWSEMQPTSYDYDIEELATEDYEVEFVNGMFVAKCLEQRFPTHELLTNFDLNEGKLAEIEIIGNIHDKESI